MIGRPIKYLLEQNKEYNPSDLFTSLLRTESSRFVFTAGTRYKHLKLKWLIKDSVHFLPQGMHFIKF